MNLTRRQNFSFYPRWLRTWRKIQSLLLSLPSSCQLFLPYLQSQEKVTVTRSLTGGRSIRTIENILPHPKHAFFSLLSEEGFQLGIFLSGGRLNTFLDSAYLLLLLFRLRLTATTSSSILLLLLLPMLLCFYYCYCHFFRNVCCYGCYFFDSLPLLFKGTSFSSVTLRLCTLLFHHSQS